MNGLPLLYSPRKALSYFDDLLAKRKQADPLEADLLRAERFAARPLKARGLTQPDSVTTTINIASQIVISSNPARRLLVFVMVDADYFVQPIANLSGTGDGLHVQASEPYLVIEESVWGVFATTEWYAWGTIANTTVRMFTETYLR